jgi:hypothetical protein
MSTVPTDDHGYPVWHRHLERLFTNLSDPNDHDCLAADLQEAGMEEEEDLEVLLEPAPFSFPDLAAATEHALRDRLDALLSVSLRATEHFIRIERSDKDFDEDACLRRLVCRWLSEYAGNAFCLDVLDRADALSGKAARSPDPFAALCAASARTNAVVVDHFPEAMLAVLQPPHEALKSHALLCFFAHRALAPRGAANRAFFRKEIAASLAALSDEVWRGGVDCRDPETGRTLLHRAVLSGNADGRSGQGRIVLAAAALLHAGADVSCADANGATPLSDAVRDARLGVVLSTLVLYGRSSAVVDRGGVGVRQLARLTAEVKALRRALLRSRRETAAALVAMGRLIGCAPRTDQTAVGGAVGGAAGGAGNAKFADARSADASAPADGSGAGDANALVVVQGTLIDDSDGRSEAPVQATRSEEGSAATPRARAETGAAAAGGAPPRAEALRGRAAAAEPPMFAAGNRVEANFEGSGEWFEGTVSAVTQSAGGPVLYTVRYDDGDSEEAVAAARLRPPPDPKGAETETEPRG